MRGFWVSVARDWRTYDFKCNTILVPCEKWQNPVELIEGARPSMHEHKRQNLLILMVWWPHMNEVHIQTCIKAKALVWKKQNSQLGLGQASKLWDYCRAKKTMLIQRWALCTLYFGLEVWIFVELCHLLFPVKLVPPIGNHLLEISGIEAILEATIF